MAQGILAQAISVQDDTASACSSLCFGEGFLCIPVRRRHMPRKGWSQMNVPSGRVQILRGPRPRAAQWPRASSQHRQPAVQGQKPSVLHLPKTVSGVAPLQLPSRSPETVTVEAVAEVK